MYPKIFKIIIIDKTTNAVYVTNVKTQKAFNSSIDIDLNKVNNHESFTNFTIVDSKVNINEVHDVKSGVIGIILRIVLTILIELFILYLFKYRNKKSFINVGITNFVTQFILSVVLFLVYYMSCSLIYVVALVIGEIIVVSIETIYYSITLKEQSKKTAILYGIVSNIVTILVTLIPF